MTSVPAAQEPPAEGRGKDDPKALYGGSRNRRVTVRDLALAKERAQIRGFLINKFRGEVKLFDAGLDAVTRMTGWPS